MMMARTLISPGAARQAVAVAALILAGLAPRAARGAEPARLETLDVFVLVDVSRSMYLDPAQFQAEVRGEAIDGPPAGSDPHRQRWDAARLLLNLLTDDDRATILPFNDQTPAAIVDQNGLAYFVPGPIADDPRAPRDGKDRLGGWVEAFAHDGDDPTPRQAGPTFHVNRDFGGTGIFIALRAARDRALKFGGEASRRPVIVLLTDGDDQSLPAEDRDRVNRDDAALLAQITGEGASGPAIPVYTIGMGNEVKDDLLIRIARLTGGSHRKIGPATDLVPTFRDLIWSLKYCWIKMANPEDRRSVEGLKGILDLGVLSSRTRGEAPFAREARPPAPSPTIRDAGFIKAHEGQRRTGNQARDHLYEYFHFGPRRPAGELIQADWSGDPDAATRVVGFSKRTARPLFTLAEPAPGAEADRLERIEIQVQFNPLEPFRREDFRLWWSLRPAGSEASSVKPTAMRADGRAEAAIPRSSGAASRFTLRIEAEGVGSAQTHPLAGYRLILPERTIEIRDALRLRAVPPVVKLTGEARRATVTIQGVRPLAGDVALSYRFEPPIHKGAQPGEDRPIDPEAIKIRPRLGSADAREVSVQDDAAELELTLEAGPRQPPLGDEYGPGMLIVASRPETGAPPVEIRVPVHLQLRPAALAVVPPGPIQLVHGKGQDQPPPRLRVVDDGGLGPAAGEMSSVIELKRVRGDEFAPDELWVEPADAPAGAARSRVLSLPLGHEFVIRFQPHSHFGRHEYRIDAKLAGKDERQATPAAAAVSLEHEFPRLATADPIITARVPRGEFRRASIRVSIEGPKGLRRPVLLRAAPSGQDEPFVRIAPEERPLEAAADATTSVPFGIQVAPDAPPREYALDVALVDADGAARETKAVVKVVVDELRVTDRTLGGSPVDGAIPIELWVGAAHAHRLELSTALSKDLPGPLRLVSPGDEPPAAADPAATRAEIDPRDDGGFSLLPRRPSLRLDDDPSGRVVIVEFPPINNVAPNRAYRVFLDLLPGAETGLPPKLLEFEVRYRRTNQFAPSAR